MPSAKCHNASMTSSGAWNRGGSGRAAAPVSEALVVVRDADDVTLGIGEQAELRAGNALSRKDNPPT